MAEPNAYLVKQKIGILEGFAHIFDDQILHPVHELFVPDYFIIGNFINTNQGFILSETGFRYKDSTEDLEEYAKMIKSNKLDVVKLGFIDHSFLESIATKSKEYISSKDNLFIQAKSLNDYL